MTKVFDAICLFIAAGLANACLLSDSSAKGAATAPSSANPPAVAAAAETAAVSIVLVHVDGEDVDWSAPWGSGKPWTRTLTGLVVEGHRILVLGTGLRNLRHVGVQKPGAVARVPAKVALFDINAGFGVLTVDDPGFWTDVRPAVLASAISTSGRATISHAKAEGLRLETADVVITGLETFGRCDFVFMKMAQNDARPVGPSDVASVNGQVVGLVMNWSNHSGYVLGAPMLIDFLAEAEHQPYRGYGAADLRGQKLSNPALREELGLAPEEGGFLVSQVWSLGSASGALEPGDVVLSVGGTKVDSDGTYAGPGGTRISMQSLFSAGHHPGDAVPVQILRRGERRTVNVVLKRFLAEQALVPWFGPDSHGYVARGGLVFERLSREYLVTFGKEWETKSPPRLLEPWEMERWESSPERAGVIALTRVLPVPATLGYEHIGSLVVESVNDVPVHSLDEVRAAFDSPKGGYHVVTFAAGQGMRRIVLDAREADDADLSIRRMYDVEH